MQTYDEIIATAAEKLTTVLAVPNQADRGDISVWAVHTSLYRDGFIQIGGGNPFPQACDHISLEDATPWHRLDRSQIYAVLHKICLGLPILPISRTLAKLPDDWSVVKRGSIEFVVGPLHLGPSRRVFFDNGGEFNFILYEALRSQAAGQVLQVWAGAKRCALSVTAPSPPRLKTVVRKRKTPVSKHRATLDWSG